MQGEMLGERTRARPPMRSAETEAAAISIATPRIPSGRHVAWVSVPLERDQVCDCGEVGREGGGGELRNQLCLSLLIRSLSLYLTLQLDGLRLHVDGECRLQTSRQGVFVWCLLCTWPSGFWLEGECASSACGLLRCLTLRCTCAPLCTERVCFDLGWQECNEGSQRLCPPHASRARCSTKP